MLRGCQDYILATYKRRCLNMFVLYTFSYVCKMIYKLQSNYQISCQTMFVLCYMCVCLLNKDDI